MGKVSFILQSTLTIIESYTHYTKIYSGEFKNQYVKSMEFKEKIQNNVFLTLK